MKRPMLTFSLIGLVAVIAPQGGRTQNAGRPSAEPARTVRKGAQIAEVYGKLPLSFEANVGQTDRRVKFVSRGAGYVLFLTGDELILKLKKQAQGAGKPDPLRRSPKLEQANQSVLRIKLAGSNGNARATGLEEQPGKSNYFIGSDRSNWRTNVPNYSKVRLHDVYPGIDLVYYGNHRRLEEDFVVAPGADPAGIAMKIGGAARISITDGELVVAGDGGEVRLRKPTIYQETANGRREVSGAYALRSTGEVTIRVSNYDRSQPLIIDPVLAYSTYLGGSVADYGNSIAVDSSGEAYVTGIAESANFPGTGPSSIQPTLGGSNNAFVTKINAAGTAIVYSTYLGGSGSDTGNGIAVDSSGNAYVTGVTASTDFPTMNPIQPAMSGDFYNVFVTEINAEGTMLVYSTYLGGNGNDGHAGLGINGDAAYGIAVDPAGNAYVTGLTFSSNFPTKNPLQATLGSGANFNSFVTEISAGGTALVYSTYLGGDYDDQGYAIAVDSAGNAYVTGSTNSPNFPGTSTSPIQSTLEGTSASSCSVIDLAPCVTNAFVTKIAAGGMAIVYSTYLGGTTGDIGAGIAVDSSGNAYVTGSAGSANFPGTSSSPIQSHLGGLGADYVTNAFVTEINAAGTALVYSTYLGGSTSDAGNAIAVDSSGNAYVTGYTDSADFPTVNAIQPSLIDFSDLFVSEINAGGTALVYSTYLGGSPNYDDSGHGIAVDCSGSAYVTGSTESTNFNGTTSSLIQPTKPNVPDNSTGFVTKIAPVAFTTSAGRIGVCAVPVASLPTPLPAGVTFPYGFFSWTVTGLTPGQTVTVTMTFPAAIPSDAQYWKVIGGEWTNATSLFTANGTNVATLTITDGGFGDEDGTVNGSITDPGGVGIPPPQETVPNVVGLTQSAATTAITSDFLVLGTVTTAYSSTVPSGSVISETPAAGTLVNTGSAVNLVVSLGPQQVAVPNVVGLTQSAATAAITSAGLVLATVTTASSGTVPSGSVISETPAAGTLVNTGSAVNLVVSSGSSTEVRITVEFLPFIRRFHQEFPGSTTVGTVLADALAFFDLKDDQGRFFLEYEGRRLTNSGETLKQLLGTRREAHFHLLGEFAH